MKLLAKRNQIDPETIELYCSFSGLNNDFRYLAAIIHSDHFGRDQFPTLCANDEALLILMEAHHQKGD